MTIRDHLRGCLARAKEHADTAESRLANGESASAVLSELGRARHWLGVTDFELRRVREEAMREIEQAESEGAR